MTRRTALTGWLLGQHLRNTRNRPEPKWWDKIGKPTKPHVRQPVRVSDRTEVSDARRTERFQRANRNRSGQPLRRQLGNRPTGRGRPVRADLSVRTFQRLGAQTDPMVRENMRRTRAHEPLLIRVSR